MAKFDIKAGASIDLLTKEELDSSLNAAIRVPYQAVSMIRLPNIAGQATGGVLSMGGDTNPEHGPGQGYTWSIRHLVITGMTRGSTPDVIQILRGQLVVWELNGNQYAQTWGRGEMILQPGETWSYRNAPGLTFAATGQIVIHGMAWQAPAEFAAELVT